MIPEFETIIKEISTKPSWGKNEVLLKLNPAFKTVENKFIDEGKIIITTSLKKIVVEEIKKYDIVYLPIIGYPHYLLVHKIIGEVVYGLVLTSKDYDWHFLHEITSDRFFIGNYVSNTYYSVSLEEAKKSFVRVFESKREADEIFKKGIELYRKIFNFKK